MDQGLGIVGFDDVDFDPFTTIDRSHGMEAVGNPHAEIARQREMAPVHKGEFREIFGSPPDNTMAHLQHFTVYGYAEVDRALYEVGEFSNTIYENNIGKGFGRSITIMDAPEHTKYRRLFQMSFMPGQIAQWGSKYVQPVVHELIDTFVERGKVDLVSAFTLHYPFNFIYRQLGLPKEDVKTFHALAVGLMCVSVDLEHGMEANRKLGDYFERLLEARRRHPGEDLVSQLAKAEIDGEKLPDDVIIAFLRQLLNAGGDTTFRATGSTMTGLLTNPDQLAAVQADRTLVAQAVLEGLRWEPPTMAILRTPFRDINFGGIDIPAGAALDVVVGAANRDPRQFADPDRFDIFRTQKRAMTFGYGPHNCIGQHLARLEMAVAINALLDRLPKLRLDDREPPPEIIGLTKRSPLRLDVRFD